jgi:hypothetical protein
MFEEKRIYKLTEVQTPTDEAIKRENISACAKMMASQTQTLCTGFKIGEYLFLNDATSEDGAHEYAVMKIKQEIDQPQTTLKVILCDKIESATMDWMGYAAARRFIEKIIDGLYVTPLRADIKIYIDTSIHHSCRYCQ